MKRFLITISIAALFMMSQLLGLTAQQRVKVDYSSDQTFMLKSGDTTVMKLVGEVYFYHNGAVISCDTAYYTPQTNKFEGIGRVIINQDSMNIYGDKILYNRQTNIARVIAPLVKVADPTTVMYTPDLEYNTLTSIADFKGGATVQHKETTLESEEGFYDTKQRVVLLRHNVAIKHPDYIAMNDSLDFYLDTEELDFECRTYIWRTNGDFMRSDKGNYHSAVKLYEFKDSSYIMTKEQELWADSMDYYSLIEEVILRGNIQILDSVKRVLSFGDYGQYWRDSENILLTHNPSVLNISEDKADSMFMRSDTLFIRPYIEKSIIDSLANYPDSVRQIMQQQQSSIAIDSSLVDKYSGDVVDGQLPLTIVDTLATIASDSLMVDSLGVDSTLSVDSLVVDTIIDIEAMSRTEYKAYKKRLRQERKLARKTKFLKWLEEGGMTITVDTVNIDTTQAGEGLVLLDSNTAQNEIVTVKNEPDSSDYIIRGFGQSRVFNKQFQLICDSILTETVDSTTTFIGRPILWNENNQIVSQRMRSFTQNGAVERTRLFGEPIISQYVEPERFNQIKGNIMDAMFRNNEIYRLYVTDASEALFYKQQDFNNQSSPIEGLIFATSKNMTIDIDSMAITTIKFYEDIETITYPINKIDGDQILFLNGFEWHEDLKPAKKDVFDRSILPSYRTKASKIEQPTFDITSKIDEMKVSYSNQGVWSDRSEVIPLARKVFNPE